MGGIAILLKSRFSLQEVLRELLWMIFLNFKVFLLHFGGKIDPGGSKIDPGGSKIDPGGPGGSQTRPKKVFLCFLGYSGGSFGGCF